ncbi:MAG: glycosyltransferase family 9 protein [Alphaproteobacteria bacterium]
MEKKILVFSNGEKIGDGIIKLPLLYEVKKRLPEYKLVWVTNKGSTAYSDKLKFIAEQYIDEIIEKADLSPFFWMKISKNYDFENTFYDYILDTQKSLYRTIALKRIKNKKFISATANGFFSSIKFIKKNKRRYYLDDLFALLDLIKKSEIEENFKIKIPKDLDLNLNKFFKKDQKYFGIAPGAGEKNKIWNLENFINVGKHFLNKNYKVVLFLGPEEKHLREKILHEFPEAIIPEDLISNFSNIETIIASTKYLKFALCNDSGVSHMLSTSYCPLIKLFGPKESLKFTPSNINIHTISASIFNNNNKIDSIPVEYVIDTINKLLE